MLHTYRTALAHQGSSSRGSRTPSSPGSKAGSGSSTPKNGGTAGRTASSASNGGSRAASPSPSPTAAQPNGTVNGAPSPLSSPLAPSSLPPKHLSQPRGADEAAHLNGHAAHPEAFDINTPAGVPSPIVSQPPSPSLPPPPYGSNAAKSSVLPLPSSLSPSSQSARDRSATASTLQVNTGVVLPPPPTGPPRAHSATMNGAPGKAATVVNSPQSDSHAATEQSAQKAGASYAWHSQPVSPRPRDRPLLLSTLLPGLFPSSSSSSSSSSSTGVTTSPLRTFASPPRKSASGFQGSPALSAVAEGRPVGASPPQLAASSSSASSTSSSSSTAPASSSALTPEKMHLSPGMSRLLHIRNQRKEEDNEKRRREDEEAEQQQRAAEQLAQQPLDLHQLEPRLRQLEHERERSAHERADGGVGHEGAAAQGREQIVLDSTRQLSRGPSGKEADERGQASGYSLPVLMSGVVLLGVSAWAGWRWYERQQRRLRR